MQIFLYGGSSVDIDDTVNAGVRKLLGLTHPVYKTSANDYALRFQIVYVLSLPAFNWQKQDYTPTFGRFIHTCNVVGNRQMVVVGGITATIDSGLDNAPPDPWSKGLGIFDLTAMEWKTEYNADAASYVTPQVVKSWYQQHGDYPASWSDNEVSSWFVKKGEYSSALLLRFVHGSELSLRWICIEQNCNFSLTQEQLWAPKAYQCWSDRWRCCRRAHCARRALLSFLVLKPETSLETSFDIVEIELCRRTKACAGEGWANSHRSG